MVHGGMGGSKERNFPPPFFSFGDASPKTTTSIFGATRRRHQKLHGLAVSMLFLL